MTAWHEFSNQSPEIATRVSDLAGLIRQQDSLRQEYLEERGMSPRAASIAAEGGSPPNGVYGAGAWVRGARVHPAIFVQPGLAPLRGAFASQAQVRYLFDDRDRYLLSGVQAVALTPPIEFAAPIASGDSVTVGSRHGTLGTTASWNGEPGILTAGHATNGAGSIVRDVHGDVVGTVQVSLSRGSCLPPGPTADAAFVATGSRNVIRRWSTTRVGTARVREPVTVWRPSGPAESWVQGLMPEMVVTPDSASWGEVILTGTAIATAGDSGAAVENRDGTLIGHVVGGTPKNYSVIQDADYQLTALGAIVV